MEGALYGLPSLLGIFTGPTNETYSTKGVSGAYKWQIGRSHRRGRLGMDTGSTSAVGGLGGPPPGKKIENLRSGHGISSYLRTDN